MTILLFAVSSLWDKSLINDAISRNGKEERRREAQRPVSCKKTQFAPSVRLQSMHFAFLIVLLRFYAASMVRACTFFVVPLDVALLPLLSSAIIRMCCICYLVALFFSFLDVANLIPKLLALVFLCFVHIVLASATTCKRHSKARRFLSCSNFLLEPNTHRIAIAFVCVSSCKTITNTASKTTLRRGDTRPRTATTTTTTAAATTPTVQEPAQRSLSLSTFILVNILILNASVCISNT